MADATDWQGEERRRLLRFARRLGVSCRLADGEGEAAEGESENVSVGGMLLLTSSPFPIGARIELTFSTGEDEVTVRVPGTVKRCAPHGAEGQYEVAVEFTEADGTQRAVILSLAPGLGAGTDGWQNRDYVRVPCTLEIAYRAGLLGGWHRGIAEDLGVGGLRFRADSPLRVGGKVTVRLPLGGEAPVTLTGVVVDIVRGREGERGAASVSFLAPAAAARKALADYVVSTLSAADSPAN